MKYIVLVSISFLLSSVSTSFFLPVFGTISAFLAGCATQQVYDFIHSPSGRTLSPIVRKAASFFYYVLPNFSAFDLKVNAIYGIPLSVHGLLYTGAYFASYVCITLSLAVIIFVRRELL
jgi:hypothetical protein